MNYGQEIVSFQSNTIYVILKKKNMNLLREKNNNCFLVNLTIE